jgi:beta-glucanase (GH16 family)
MALIAVLPGCSQRTAGEPNTGPGAGGTLAVTARTAAAAGAQDSAGDGGSATGQSVAAESSAPPGYALVFEDDFTSGSAPDPDVYFYHFTWGDESNPENDPAFVQGLTDTTGRGGYVNDAQTISGGLLKLTAVKGNARYGGQDFPYRTGMVRLKRAFLYGYFEISAKMPPGVGLLPQFWLMPEEYDDTALWEIDVFEAPSTSSSSIYMNVHWGSGYGGPNHRQNMTNYAGNFAERFRTFAVEWLRDRIVWYVDGVEVKRHTRENGEISPVPMQVICNLDVGGTWPGSPDQSTPFPAVLAIDYLRVYQKP